MNHGEIWSCNLRWLIEDGIFTDTNSGHKARRGKYPQEAIPSWSADLDGMLVRMRQTVREMQAADPEEKWADDLARERSEDLAECFLAIDDWLCSGRRVLPRCWSGAEPHPEVVRAADTGKQG